MSVLLQKLFFILSALSFLGVIFLIFTIIDLKKKIKMLCGGNDKATESEANLQQDILRRLMRTEARLELHEPRLEILEKISQVSVQKVGFMRFNPFQDTGGDQSFVMALLDRDLNGIILSSLYSREGTKVYAKEIQKGIPQHPLSEEEKTVLEKTL